MGVINFAHSALFMLGAYTGLVVHRLVGDFWLGLLVAPAVVGVVGAAVERLLLRPLRTRFPASHLLPLLLTFGLGLFLEGAAKVVWGADILSLSKPRLLEGAVQLGPITFPAYWLFALLAAVVLATLVWLLVERTPLGLTIRAATQDPDDGLRARRQRLMAQHDRLRAGLGPRRRGGRDPGRVDQAPRPRWARASSSMRSSRS